MKEDKQQNIKKFVWACAWCELKEETPLQDGQEYTHGICDSHKQKIIASLYSGPLLLGNGN